MNNGASPQNNSHAQNQNNGARSGRRVAEKLDSPVTTGEPELVYEAPSGKQERAGSNSPFRALVPRKSFHEIGLALGLQIFFAVTVFPILFFLVSAFLKFNLLSFLPIIFSAMLSVLLALTVWLELRFNRIMENFWDLNLNCLNLTRADVNSHLSYEIKQLKAVNGLRIFINRALFGMLGLSIVWVLVGVQQK